MGRTAGQKKLQKKISCLCWDSNTGSPDVPHSRSEKNCRWKSLAPAGIRTRNRSMGRIAKIRVFVHRQTLKVEERKYCMRCHIGLCKAVDSVFSQVEELTSRVKYATHWFPVNPLFDNSSTELIWHFVRTCEEHCQWCNQNSGAVDDRGGAQYWECKRITNCERRDRVNSACLSLGRVNAAVASGIWHC